MRKPPIKIIGEPQPDGFENDVDFNSPTEELENAVKPWFPLDNEIDDKQLQQVFETSSKSRFYKDSGSENALLLTRPATNSTLEEFNERFYLFFTPAFSNTGKTTVQINNKDVKDVWYQGYDLGGGEIVKGEVYLLFYVASTDTFEIRRVANTTPPAKLGGLYSYTPTLSNTNWVTLTSEVAPEDGIYAVSLKLGQNTVSTYGDAGSAISCSAECLFFIEGKPTEFEASHTTSEDQLQAVTVRKGEFPSELKAFNNYVFVVSFGGLPLEESDTTMGYLNVQAGDVFKIMIRRIEPTSANATDFVYDVEANIYKVQG